MFAQTVCFVKLCSSILDPYLHMQLCKHTLDITMLITMGACQEEAVYACSPAKGMEILQCRGVTRYSIVNAGFDSATDTTRKRGSSLCSVQRSQAAAVCRLLKGSVQLPENAARETA